jgi:hypothetical protein
MEFFFRCENLSHADSKTAHWMGRVGFEGEAIAAARGLLWNYVRVEDGGGGVAENIIIQLACRAGRAGAGARGG